MKAGGTSHTTSTNTPTMQTISPSNKSLTPTYRSTAPVTHVEYQASYKNQTSYIKKESVNKNLNITGNVNDNDYCYRSLVHPLYIWAPMAVIPTSISLLVRSIILQLQQYQAQGPQAQLQGPQAQGLTSLKGLNWKQLLSSLSPTSLTLLATHIGCYMALPPSKGQVWNIPGCGLLPVVFLQGGSDNHNQEEQTQKKLNDDQSLDSALKISNNIESSSLKFKNEKGTVDPNSPRALSIRQSKEIVENNNSTKGETQYPSGTLFNHNASIISGPSYLLSNSRRLVFNRQYRKPTIYLLHPHGLFVEAVGSLITTISLLQRDNIIPQFASESQSEFQSTNKSKGTSTGSTYFTMLYDKQLVRTSAIGMFMISLGGANDIDFLGNERVNKILKDGKHDVGLLAGGFFECNCLPGKKNFQVQQQQQQLKEVIYLGQYEYWIKKAIEYGYAVETVRIYNGATIYGESIIVDKKINEKLHQNSGGVLDSTVALGESGRNSNSNNRFKQQSLSQLKQIQQSQSGPGQVTSEEESKSILGASDPCKSSTKSYQTSIQSTPHYKYSIQNWPALVSFPPKQLVKPKIPNARTDKLFVRCLRTENPGIPGPVNGVNDNVIGQSLTVTQTVEKICNELKRLEGLDRAYVKKVFKYNLPDCIYIPIHEKKKRFKDKVPNKQGNHCKNYEHDNNIKLKESESEGRLTPNHSENMNHIDNSREKLTNHVNLYRAKL